MTYLEFLHRVQLKFLTRNARHAPWLCSAAVGVEGWNILGDSPLTRRFKNQLKDFWQVRFGKEFCIDASIEGNLELPHPIYSVQEKEAIWFYWQQQEAYYLRLEFLNWAIEQVEEEKNG